MSAPRSTIGKYTLLETLGSGASAKVKLCQDESGQQYAIKIFDLTNPRFTAKALDYLEKEVQIYQMMNHANIVQLYEANMNGVKQKPNGIEKKVAYIVLELVNGGELFDFVALENFSEPIARFYFRQMMQALHYVHSIGACHIDLKPENILLDSQFNIKIADFGFAAPLQGRDGSGFLSTYLGTPSYMAPEILEGQNYQGHVVDLFAAGVILFTLRAGHPPFNAALQKDSYYKLLAMNRADLFWKTHSKNKPPGFFSDEFMDLITNLLQVMPHQRLALAEIIGHPWLQGETASLEQVQSEFQSRFQKIKEQQEKDALEKKEQAAYQAQQSAQQATKKVHRGAINNKVYCNFNPETDDIDQIKAQAQEENKDSQSSIIVLQMKQYKPKTKATVLFSTWRPEDILQKMNTVLEDMEVKAEISDKKWRMLFEFAQKLTDEEKESGLMPQTAKVQLDLLSVKQEGAAVALEFSRVQGGSGELFMNKFLQLKQELAELNAPVPMMA